MLSAQSFLIEKIEISGNKRTKEWVIKRELSLKIGDEVNSKDSSKLLLQNKKQLLNSELFNDVDIHFEGSVLKILVSEKWYFWPIPVIDLADRNFNQWWLSKDPRRLIYGTELKLENLNGRNERLYGNLTLGYTRQADLTYEIPVFEKYQNLGLVLNGAIIANKEVWLKTEDNKVQFYNNVEEFGITRSRVSAKVIKRKGVNQYQTFSLGWKQARVTDTVAVLNPDFLGDGKKQLNIFSTNYSFILDQRDVRGQPLKGNYFNLQLGLNHIAENKSEEQWIPELRYRSSHFLPVSGRWFSSAGIHFKVSQNMPYRFNRAIGYDYQVVRGYEYYVADGPVAAVFKTNVKYALLLNKKYRFGFIPVESYKEANNTLFLLAFYDGGFAENRNPEQANSFNNRYLQGYGVGVEWVVWFDRMIRFEYSRNHIGEMGLYVSFKMGI